MNSERRTYNSSNRKASALQTKTRILSAAKALFQEKGFEKVTIPLLAKEAEVSVPTIYALYKSKRGVLQSLIDSALPQEKFEELVSLSMKESSPINRLNLTAKLCRKIYDAESDLILIIREAAVVAPQYQELEHERERRRFKRQETFVKKLKEDGHLSNHLTLEQARDLLWSLTGRDFYRLLVTEREWPSNEYEKWLSNILHLSLLGS